jgi:hypothetical protein
LASFGNLSVAGGIWPNRGFTATEAPARRAMGLFGYSDQGLTVFFPLWYPALILTLAGVGALRLGRRFTLRSATIATTVVAGLLGMAVVM